MVKSDVVKKVDYNTKITWIENRIPDINNVATKTALTAVENKIPDTSGLVKKTDYNTKITDIESKIPDITNLVTKTTLTSVENKIPDISNLARKTALTNLSNTVPDINTLILKSDSDRKIRETENKFVSKTGFDSKLAQANVFTKRNVDAKIIENNIKKLQSFDSGYFVGKNYFGEDGTQNYAVYLLIFRFLNKYD